MDLVYELQTLGMISDKAVYKRLTDYNIIRNEELAELIQHWFAKRKITDIKPEVVVGMIRSIYFIQFHKKALGVNMFDKIQSALVDSISKVLE